VYICRGDINTSRLLRVADISNTFLSESNIRSTADEIDVLRTRMVLGCDMGG